MVFGGRISRGWLLRERRRAADCACAYLGTKMIGSIWPLRMIKYMVRGRREEVESGTQRCLVVIVGGVWTICETSVEEAGSVSWRSCARRLVGSAARWLDGPSSAASSLLTGPVKEAPEVNLRRSARSDHQTKLVARYTQAELRRIPAFLSVEAPVRKPFKSKWNSTGHGGNPFLLLLVRRRVYFRSHGRL